MLKLTVFTPTYNRKQLLKRCYDSLRRQTNKNFLWMIIDDGSTDGTNDEVKEWIEDNEIQIEYHYQENHGKAYAINESIRMCVTELWVCLDSDDYLTEDAVDIICSEAEIACTNPDCCGIIGNKFDIDTQKPISLKSAGIMPQKMPSSPKYTDYEDILYKYKVRADIVYIFFTEKLIKYRMPIFEGEKFIAEGVLFNKIGRDYVFYITCGKIYMCKYLPDGLTANRWYLHINNPKGYKYLKQQSMLLTRHKLYKYKNAISYVVGCILCGDTKIIRNSPMPKLTALAFIPGKLLYALRYKPLIKEARNKQ